MITDTDRSAYIERFVRQTKHINYKGVSLGEALRIPFNSLFGLSIAKRTGKENFIQIVYRLSTIVFHICAGIAKFKNKKKKCPKKTKNKIAVILDHPNHVEKMAMNMLASFNPDTIKIFSFSKRVCQNISKGKYDYEPSYGYIKNWDPKLLLIYCRFYKDIIKSIHVKELLFKLNIFYSVCMIINAIDYYINAFNTNNIFAVITMSDRHWHEFVATTIARQNKIKTYTNQHGWFRILAAYIPIASDKMFVWGNKCKDYLIDNGVRPNQIVVSGNPQFDEVRSHYLKERNRIKKSFAEEYKFLLNKPIVIYLCPAIAGSLPYERSYQYFKCFCRTFEFTQNVIIKLKPKLGYKNVYIEWLEKMGINPQNHIFQNENLYYLLTASDIAVSTGSTAGLEAMGFGIPTIILNSIQNFDIARSASFIHDTIECKSENEFVSVIKKLIEDKTYYEKEKNKVNLRRTEYFRNFEGINSSTLIKNTIFR